MKKILSSVAVLSAFAAGATDHTHQYGGSTATANLTVVPGGAAASTTTTQVRPLFVSWFGGITAGYVNNIWAGTKDSGKFGDDKIDILGRTKYTTEGGSLGLNVGYGFAVSPNVVLGAMAFATYNWTGSSIKTLNDNQPYADDSGAEKIGSASLKIRNPFTGTFLVFVGTSPTPSTFFFLAAGPTVGTFHTKFSDTSEGIVNAKAKNNTLTALTVGGGVAIGIPGYQQRGYVQLAMLYDIYRKAKDLRLEGDNSPADDGSAVNVNLGIKPRAARVLLTVGARF